MRINHIKQSAINHAGFNEIGKEALSVFAFTAFKREVLTLAKQLDITPTKNTSLECDDEGWQYIMENLIDCLSASPETDIDLASLLSQNNEEEQCLSHRLSCLLSKIDYAQSCVDEQSSATGLLLPISFAKRIELTLGYGKLPLAWIRELDVLVD